MSTDYTRGSLAIMDNHPPTQQECRVVGLTPKERAFLDACGSIIPPIPQRLIRKSVGVPPTPEAQAAFSEWLATPEADRPRGLISHLARKHAAVIHQVHNLVTRHKKGNHEN